MQVSVGFFEEKVSNVYWEMLHCMCKVKAEEYVSLYNMNSR